MLTKLRYFKYFFKYLFDPAIPFYKKIWIYLAIFYFLSPFDLIPDPILGIGWLDDAVILIIAFIGLSGVLERYAEGNNRIHRSPKDGETIENVQYKVHHDD